MIAGTHRRHVEAVLDAAPRGRALSREAAAQLVERHREAASQRVLARPDLGEMLPVEKREATIVELLTLIGAELGWPPAPDEEA